MTTNEIKTTADQVIAGQRVRFTGGHSATVARIRTEAGYTYLYEGEGDAPYALPNDATVFVLRGGRTEDVQRMLDRVHATKAPTKRAAVVAEAITTLATQAEVDDFTRELRRRAGVQDVALLPNTTWKVTGRRNGTEIRLAGEEVTTAVLLNTLEGAELRHIDWPSVTFHWGVMVTFTWGGVDYIARSADYAHTETYLSS
jgi:hypothetical protein